MVIILIFGVWAVLRRASVFSPVACLDVPNRLGLASTVYGKTLLPSGFVGIRELPS